MSIEEAGETLLRLEPGEQGKLWETSHSGSPEMKESGASAIQYLGGNICKD